VTDYGNSTYLVDYTPTVSGTFRMYVTIGCCAPHPNLGFPTEVETMLASGILIEGAPFTLEVSPGELVIARTIATGAGLISSVAGEPAPLTLHHRDVHDNPAVVSDPAALNVHAYFTDMHSGHNVSLMAPAGPLTIEVSPSADVTGVTYTMTRAGTWYFHLQLNGQDVLGSPFVTVIHPAKADAAHAVCSGVGVRSGSTTNNFPFKVQWRDAFGNDLKVGGVKLYARLRGDSYHTKGTVPTVPLCDDDNKGALYCTHRAAHPSAHHLDLRMLNYDMDTTGGRGLTGRYFTGEDMFRSASGKGADLAPAVTRIEPTVAFSWPTGQIVPGLERLTAQSARWEGYLVAPKTDTYTFETAHRNVAVIVYVDEHLVLDSESDTVVSISLQRSVAYMIRVEARSSLTKPHEASLELLWSTPTLKPTRIPRYFLHDSAKAVAFSPFPVSVTNGTAS